MSIMKWRPMLDPFEEMEEMMKRFLPNRNPINRKSFIPAVDVYEENGRVVVEAPLAGINPKDVSISVEDNVLTIKGESKKEHEVDDKSYYRKEVRMGSFFRQISLPSTVNKEKISADFKDGVLKITCPIKEEKKEIKKIDININ
ncbi:MAG: Hsp20/alpha crystallin family protein [Candidatus Magasanikbacteria bacterium]|nr:Hsp20/alpha crystallin family protein [Candidatus Magasanikbacteria bacterium]